MHSSDSTIQITLLDDLVHEFTNKPVIRIENNLKQMVTRKSTTNGH